MDRERCLKILRDVDVGKKAVRLISWFWKQGVLCCRAAGYYGRILCARRGVIQDGSLSPTIFNLMVDAVVRELEQQLMAGGGWDWRTSGSCSRAFTRTIFWWRRATPSISSSRLIFWPPCLTGSVRRPTL